MYEFSVLFLIVSVFALDAFCTSPSHLGQWSPPPPEKVELSECFVVRDITGGSFANVRAYDYHLICPQKLPDAGVRQPRDEKNWYFVRTFADCDTAAPAVLPFDYALITQSLVKFVFLDDTMVKFVTGLTEPTYKITFQSLEQSQAFYVIIYSDVSLSKAAPSKIRLLHEIILQDRVHKQIGKNLEALSERIENVLYITFKNDRGEPLLVFSQDDAAIMRMKRSQDDSKQLLFRMHTKNYILTFTSWTETKQFSYALLKYVRSIVMSRMNPDVVDSFQNNRITIDDSPEFFRLI